MNWLARIALIISTGMMLIAGLYFSGGQELAETGLAWALAGGLVLSGALIAYWERDDAPPYLPYLPPSSVRTPNGASTITTRTRWIPALIGAICLFASAEINGNNFDPSPLTGMSSHLQFIILIMGILLLPYGIAGKRYRLVTIELENGDTQTLQTPAPFTWRLPEKRELIAIIAVMIFAFALRAYQVGTMQRFFIDEVHFSNPITHFSNADDVELLIPFSSVAAFPYVFPYMQSHVVNIVGRDLAGLRGLSVLLGTLNVLALYLLAKTLFDRRIAFASAGLLATLPLHLQFSRLGLNNIADPLIGTLIFYFIARAIRYQENMRGNLAWAGAFLGLTQYFYEGGRFLFPALTAAWLFALGAMMYLGWGIWRIRGRWKYETPSAILQINYKQLIASLIRMGFVAAMIGLPIYYTLAARETSVAVRMSTAGMGERVTSQLTSASALLEHFVNRLYESLLIHVSIPEAQLYFGGENPLLLEFLSPVFVIGAFFALWIGLFGRTLAKWQDANFRMQAGSILIVIWVLLTWFGNAFLQESRISARYVVELPAIALMIALGVVTLFDILIASKTMRNRIIIATITALIIPQIMWYYGPQNDFFNAQFRNGRGRNLDVDDAIFRAKELPPETRIHIIDSPAWYVNDINNIMGFMYDREGKQALTLLPEQITESYLDAQPQTIPHAFFLSDDNEDTINRILERFPDVQGPFYTDFDASKDWEFTLYIAPSIYDSSAVGAAE